MRLIVIALLLAGCSRGTAPRAPIPVPKGDGWTYVPERCRDADGKPLPVSGFSDDLYPNFAALTRERRLTDERIALWVASLREPRRGDVIVFDLGRKGSDESEHLQAREAAALLVAIARSHERTGDDVRIGTDNFTTHGVIVGMTGSGKTGPPAFGPMEIAAASKAATVLDRAPRQLGRLAGSASETFR